MAKLESKSELTDTDPQQEIATLQTRIDELERQLSEQATRANAAVAAAQQRTYWLDEWRIDPNALMRKRGALLLFKVMRRVYRLGWHLRRSLRR